MDLKDAELIETKALPAAAGSVYTDGIDLGAVGDEGKRLAECELVLTIPTLTTAQLPDTTTTTFVLQSDNDSAFGSPKDVSTLSTQTGAGGAGAAGKDVRFRVPTDAERYWRVKATSASVGNATVGNQAAASMEFSLRF